ncbi:Uncharacterised protein [Bordetella pertussis]|nr:Uncharacterised protein [Bordetella pertussis]
MVLRSARRMMPSLWRISGWRISCTGMCGISSKWLSNGRRRRAADGNMRILSRLAGNHCSASQATSASSNDRTAAAFSWLTMLTTT